MLFMVIEHFRDQNAKTVYTRFHEKGRLMPDGIGFVGSWVAADLGRCFQKAASIASGSHLASSPRARSISRMKPVPTSTRSAPGGL